MTDEERWRNRASTRPRFDRSVIEYLIAAGVLVPFLLIVLLFFTIIILRTFMGDL